MVAKVDVPAIELHDVRRTHATILLLCDGNVKAIATATLVEASVNRDSVILCLA
jgi:hypothetical protein